MILKDYNIDRTSPIPLYYQLKSIISSEIKNGNYSIGNTIPTEQELVDRFEISRSTVRQAITSLVQEGWLDRKTSKGTFVTKPEENVTHIRSFEPFHQQVEKSGKTSHTELLELRVIEAGKMISEYLNISETEKVISIFRRRLADSVPMVTMQNYLPYSLCNHILNHDFERESLYEILSEKPESRICVTKSIVSATKATAEDASLLNVKHGSPILNFNNIAKNKDEIIIDFAFARYHGDLNKFEITAYQGD